MYVWCVVCVVCTDSALGWLAGCPQFGACSPLSVRSYDAVSSRAVVSVPADSARRVAAALALSTELLGAPCVVHVHGPSPLETAPRRYFA